jgi:proteasome activator subunit 4
MTDPENKDKQRATAETLTGVIRGSKHWSGKDRKALWDWVTPQLPKLYAEIRHETFECVIAGPEGLPQTRIP